MFELNAFLSFILSPLQSIPTPLLAQIAIILAMLAAFVITMNRIGWGWLALAFTCFVMACLAFGNILSEIPTAKMFSTDKTGEMAIVGFIIGITGSMIIFGKHATNAFQKRIRDLLFCSFSVIASTVGLYAITGNADQQNQQRSALIESLKADIYAAREGRNGLDPRDGSTPCQSLPWCKSADLRAQIQRDTAQLNELMQQKTVTAFDALQPLAALLHVNVTFLAFLFGSLRTLVGMYGMLICSQVATRQFCELTGLTDKLEKLPDLETKTDKAQTRTRQTRKKRIKGQLLSGVGRFLGTSNSKRKSGRAQSDQLLFTMVFDWHLANPSIKPTTRSVNRALRAKKMATIDNNRASRIAKRIRGE